jgi:hypothetical protein
VKEKPDVTTTPPSVEDGKFRDDPPLPPSQQPPADTASRIRSIIEQHRETFDRLAE